MRAGNKYPSGMKTAAHAAHGLFRLQTAWFYDERTRLIRMTDAESHSTRYGHDDSGHLTEVILADGRNGELPVRRGGQAGKSTPARWGGITRWQRDRQGRVRSRTDAMGRRTAFGHDAWASGHAHERERRTLPVPP